MLWMETSTPSLEEAKEFADAIHAKYPGELTTFIICDSSSLPHILLLKNKNSTLLDGIFLCGKSSSSLAVLCPVKFLSVFLT